MEEALFDASDKVEWEAILRTKAVRVVFGTEVESIRRLYPERSRGTCVHSELFPCFYFAA